MFLLSFCGRPIRPFARTGGRTDDRRKEKRTEPGREGLESALQGQVTAHAGTALASCALNLWSAPAEAKLLATREAVPLGARLPKRHMPGSGLARRSRRRLVAGHGAERRPHARGSARPGAAPRGRDDGGRAAGEVDGAGGGVGRRAGARRASAGSGQAAWPCRRRSS